MSLSEPMNDRNRCRDSFGRFEDHLCEELLSYLGFEDKFRFECVSKQWKSLVYNTVIDIDDKIIPILINKSYSKSMTDNQMKILLKKCYNVSKMCLYINEYTLHWLSLLAENLPQLKTIDLVITEVLTTDAMTAFGQKYGFEVQTLDIPITHMSRDLFIKILSWCPNLKQLDCTDKSWLCLVANELVPRLECLGQINVEKDQMSAFVQLVDKYEKTLKNMDITFDGLEVQDIDLGFQQLSRLINLERIDLSLHQYSGPPLNLMDNIIALGEACSKLSKIHLGTVKLSLSHASNQALNSAFKSMDLSSASNATISPASKPTANPPSKATISPAYKTLTAIKSLSIDCREMSDNFFANVSELMPILKDFTFTSHQCYSNQDLKDLSRLKHLKRLELSSIGFRAHPIEDSAVIQLLDNCKELKELKLHFRSNITEKTISKLIEVANNRHKVTVKFTTVSGIDFGHSSTDLPYNLHIDIVEPNRFDC